MVVMYTYLEQNFETNEMVWYYGEDQVLNCMQYLIIKNIYYFVIAEISIPSLTETSVKVVDSNVWYANIGYTIRITNSLCRQA
jgi:hypothetical protein